MAKNGRKPVTSKQVDIHAIICPNCNMIFTGQNDKVEMGYRLHKKKCTADPTMDQIKNAYQNLDNCRLFRDSPNLRVRSSVRLN